MPERVVVTLRGVADLEVDEGLAYLQRATAIKRRFDAVGATLCAWGTQTFSFDLAPRDLEAAVALTAAVVAEDEGGPHRLRAAIAHGVMTSAERGGALETPSWGAPLFAAWSLARIARPGEVLLHPKLVASRSGELLLQGTRRATLEGRSIRGERLDVKQPLRRLCARGVASLREPALIGRDVTLRELAVPPGGIGVLRAAKGAGGSRLLADLTARLRPSRSLLVTPVGASREPLGAIRRALSRSSSLEVGPALPDELRESLARLLAGEGADLWSLSALLDTWLAPADGHFGVLAVDDAGELDPTSLELIVSALRVSGSFRVLLRLDADEPLPLPLFSAPIRATAAAGPLTAPETELLISTFVDGAIAPEALKRWARRSGGLPLGAREALAEGMTAGDLCMLDGLFAPRRRASGRGATGTPTRWIERRIGYLSEGERAALLALAMLGGDASDTMIDALAVGMGGPSAHSAIVVESLIAGGWVVRPEPGWLKLTSRSARDALVATLSEDARRPWYLAASGMLRHYGGLLGRADAAYYASLADDSASAQDLANEAARAAEAASLEGAATSLYQFAREIQPGSTPSRLPDSVRESLAASLFPPGEGSSESASRPDPLDDVTITELPSQPDEIVPPPGASSPPSSVAAASAFSPPPRSAVASATLASASAFPLPPRRPPSGWAPPRPPTSSGPPSLELDLDDDDDEDNPDALKEDVGILAPDEAVRVDADTGADTGAGTGADTAAGAGTAASADPSTPTQAAIEALNRVPGHLAELAKRALVSGDLATLAQIIVQLREAGEHGELVERLSSFVALGRGSKAEAVRKLAAAAEVEQPPAQRARALLAYGVALAVNGNHESALLEALRALSRAREARDAHGEEAIARFLARLSAATGHPVAANAWVEVVRRVHPSARG